MNNLTAPPPPTFTGLLTASSPANIAMPAGSVTFSTIHFSPGGDTLYVDAANTKSQIYQFSRNSSTGNLTLIGNGIVGTGATNHSNESTLAISPDGNNAYVACHNNAAIYVYNRNTGTGALTLASTPSSTNGCSSVTISNDGKFAYLGEVDALNITVVSRNTGTGALTFPGFSIITSFSHPPENIMLSPNGNYLYSYGQATAAIDQYSVNTSTGNVTQLSPNTVSTSSAVYSMAFLPNGSYAYAGISGSILIYSIGGGGQLTSVGSTTLSAGGQTYQISISPDGQNLYVSNTTTTVYQFKINALTGNLAALSPPTLSESASTNQGNGISPDGKNFYIAAGNSTVYMYKRN